MLLYCAWPSEAQLRTWPTLPFNEPQVPMRMTYRGPSVTARVSRKNRSRLPNPIRCVTMLTGHPCHAPVIVRKPRDDSTHSLSVRPGSGERRPPSMRARPSDPTPRIRFDTSPCRVPTWYVRPSWSRGKLADCSRRCSVERA